MDDQAVLTIVRQALEKVIPDVVWGSFGLNAQLLSRVPPEIVARLKEYVGWSVVAFAVPLTDDGLLVWHHHGDYRSLVANYVLERALLKVEQDLPESQVVNLLALTDQKVSMTEIGQLAGLGTRGWNNLLVHPDYGPWLQIHALLVNCTLPYNGVLDDAVCTQCGQCIEACPVKALGNGTFNAYRCQSVVASPWKMKSKAVALTSRTYIECQACLAACPIGKKPEGLFEWKK